MIRLLIDMTLRIFVGPWLLVCAVVWVLAGMPT